MYDSLKGDCKHIAFHECIKNKNNGNIVINPTQVVRYKHFFLVNESWLQKILYFFGLASIEF